MSTKFCPLHGSYDKSKEMCPTCRLNDQATVTDFTAKLDTHPKRWTFPFATALHLSKLFADVHIIPTVFPQIKVVIEGDSELVEAAELSTQDVAVIIKAPIPFKPGTYIPHNVNQPFINIGGKTYTSIQSVSFVSSGQIIIDNREVDQDRKLRLTVEVPHNITLTLRGLYGTCHVDRVDGFLTINKSLGSVFVESTQNLRLNGSGNDAVQIGKITGGEVDIANTGNGQVTILEGNCTKLHATNNGNGIMSFACTAMDCMLYNIGNGKILMSTAGGGPVDIVNKGNGQVVIDSGTASSIDIDNRGNGKVIFDGTAHQANLSCYGNGRILLTEVRGDQLNAVVEGNGSITVDTGVVSLFKKTVTGNGSVTFKGITHRQK